jgi:hypothetical protein
MKQESKIKREKNLIEARKRNQRWIDAENELNGTP